MKIKGNLEGNIRSGAAPGARARDKAILTMHSERSSKVRAHYLGLWIHSMPRINTTAGLLAFSLVFPACRLSAANACNATASDHSFLPDSSQVFIDCSTGDSDSCSVDVFPHVQVNRVVGPGINSAGTVDAMNPDGTLVNPSAYVSNGVVSPNVQLSVQYDYSLWLSTNVVVSLNGHEIGTERILGASDIPGTDPNRGSGSLSQCYTVPVEFVRFAARNLGGIPTPGDNVIELRSTIADSLDVCDDCSIVVSVGALSFKALEPVIMVHGYNEGPEWFGPQGTDPCGKDGMDFVKPFTDARMPVEYQRIDLRDPKTKKTVDIDTGAITLTKLLPKIAIEYGVHGIHMIGHSKGGLYIRRYLTELPDNFAVYTATTLETPHHGSYGADVVVNSRKYFGLMLLRNPYLIPGWFVPLTGTQDLTVDAMEKLNAQTGAPPGSFQVDGVGVVPQYFSTSADANLNGDTDPNSNPPGLGIITADEAYSYQFCVGDVPAPTALNTKIYQSAYRATQRYRRITLSGWPIPRATSVVNQPLAPNDFVVTADSSKYASFQPITSGGSDLLKYNHKTIGTPAVAQLVIQAIRTAQPTE